jgi:hypothetical protein
MSWSLEQSLAGGVSASASSITPVFTGATTEGTMLVCVLGAQAAGVTWTLPAGWIEAVNEDAAANAGVAVFYYPANPGGITSVLCQASTSAQLRAQVGEFNPGSNEGVFCHVTGVANATSAETLTATTSADPSSTDMGIACFGFYVTPSAAVTWTTPGSWSQLYVNATTGENFHLGSYYRLSGISGSSDLSVEGQVATTQNDLCGVVCTFSLVAAASATAALTLAATATGSSQRSGSVTGAVTLAASATGSSKRTGSPSGAVSLAASAVASRRQSGSVTGAVSLSATAAGQSRRSGSPGAALTLAATATGQSQRSGVAAAAVLLAVTCTGGVPGPVAAFIAGYPRFRWNAGSPQTRWQSGYPLLRWPAGQ